MSLSKLPNQLIADIADYLEYSDICNLMETNKKIYRTIKAYSKDKIKLKKLEYVDDVNPLQLEVLIEKCHSINELKFSSHCISPRFEHNFNSQICQVLLATRTIISIISITCTNMHISVDEMINLCQKFKRVKFIAGRFDTAVWNDEVLTKILPYSTIGCHINVKLEKPINAKLISDQTLKALFGKDEVQKYIELLNIPNSITVKEIVESLKIIDKLDITGIHWDLGILRRDQFVAAERYFNEETGEFMEIYELKQHGRFYQVESLVDGKFAILFSVDLA